jgi:hypothetical protein
VNSCKYCHSGIDSYDKNCSRCGAPNEEYSKTIYHNSFSGIPTSGSTLDFGRTEVRGGIGQPLLYIYKHSG